MSLPKSCSVGPLSQLTAPKPEMLHFIARCWSADKLLMQMEAIEATHILDAHEKAKELFKDKLAAGSTYDVEFCMGWSTVDFTRMARLIR